jgi:hypothetical protein
MKLPLICFMAALVRADPYHHAFYAFRAALRWIGGSKWCVLHFSLYLMIGLNDCDHARMAGWQVRITDRQE